ncbi:MAG: tellurite resistance TerB family protein [Gammaproteobacteria bacterium SHHR-1]|uniref:tellurite resistance TerB family protein n=1 Tax=Magnetovirga frankeli TaxID=947516 RepID=UPI001292FEE5|nr:tellurite resistance TerB family protein [gamma proteobacterium SS-5]
MFDAKRLLDQLVSSGAAGGLAGGLAGGALVNLLGGKKTKKLAGSALKMGGMALVGGMAYKAWQNYQQGNTQAAASAEGVPPAPPGSGFALPSSQDAAQRLSLLLVRAMISAAKADGQIDTQESQAILNQINELQLSAEDKAFLFEEYGKPLDISGLSGQVEGPEQAAEVYAASALILEPPSAAEQIYLDGLAQALNLQPGLLEQIQAQVRAAV